jgi:hypothetical protein
VFGSRDGMILGGISHLVLVFGSETTKGIVIPYENIPSKSEAASMAIFLELLI